ncbi:hypothetical protein [Sorangium sp. So ce341]|uniref:hypothetical protein n=1 Tax=Sorangium sp. So ce341 TaxID=3133302 RepID=UPI003F60C8A7
MHTGSRRVIVTILYDCELANNIAALKREIQVRDSHGMVDHTLNDWTKQGLSFVIRFAKAKELVGRENTTKLFAQLSGFRFERDEPLEAIRKGSFSSDGAWHGGRRHYDRVGQAACNWRRDGASRALLTNQHQVRQQASR